MRISDWSSDVCSSDLVVTPELGRGEPHDLELDAVWVAGVEALVDRVVAGSLQRTGGLQALDRTSVVWGKSVSVRVDLGGRRVVKKKHISVPKRRQTTQKYQ